VNKRVYYMPAIAGMALLALWFYVMYPAFTWNRFQGTAPFLFFGLLLFGVGLLPALPRRPDTVTDSPVWGKPPED